MKTLKRQKFQRLSQSPRSPGSPQNITKEMDFLVNLKHENIIELFEVIDDPSA